MNLHHSILALRIKKRETEVRFKRASQLNSDYHYLSGHKAHSLLDVAVQWIGCCSCFKTSHNVAPHHTTV